MGGSLFLAIAVWSSLNAIASPSPASAIETHCDLIGKLKSGTSADSPEHCQQLCQKDQDCKGFVFISGWKRCNLMSEVARKAKVQMISGVLNSDGNPQPKTFKEQRVDFDLKTKDIRQVSPSASAENCRDACIADARCGSYTYIQGYSTCWLKEPGEKWNPKIFSCGQKPT